MEEGRPAFREVVCECDMEDDTICREERRGGDGLVGPEWIY